MREDRLRGCLLTIHELRLRLTITILKAMAMRMMIITMNTMKAWNLVDIMKI